MSPTEIETMAHDAFRTLQIDGSVNIQDCVKPTNASDDDQMEMVVSPEVYSLKEKRGTPLQKLDGYNVYTSPDGAAYVKAQDGSLRRLNSKRHEKPI